MLEFLSIHHFLPPIKPLIKPSVLQPYPVTSYQRLKKTRQTLANFMCLLQSSIVQKRPPVYIHQPLPNPILWIIFAPLTDTAAQDQRQPNEGSEDSLCSCAIQDHTTPTSTSRGSCDHNLSCSLPYSPLSMNWGHLSYNSPLRWDASREENPQTACRQYASCGWQSYPSKVTASSNKASTRLIVCCFSLAATDSGSNPRRGCTLACSAQTSCNKASTSLTKSALCSTSSSSANNPMRLWCCWWECNIRVMPVLYCWNSLLCERVWVVHERVLNSRGMASSIMKGCTIFQGMFWRDVCINW